MKKFLLIFFLLTFTGCGDGGSDYDKGYDDAWDGLSPKKSSDSYIEGYQDGEFDADCYYYKKNNLWDKYKRLGCR